MSLYRLATVFYALTLFICDSASQESCRQTGPGAMDTSPWMTLLSNISYSPQQPPTMSKNGADHVYVALQIMDVDEINENQMYFQVQLFVISTWQDLRLNNKTFEKNRFKNDRFLIPDEAMKCFWSPSLIFDNNKDGKLFSLSVPNTMMAVFSNKTVLKASRFSVKVRCRFDLSRYPMDVQRCQFRMRLFDESDDLVQLRWIDHANSTLKGITRRADKPIEVNANIKPTRFRFNISEPWTVTKKWLNSNYTHLAVNITFSRLLTSSLLTIYIPSTITVILSWVSFWIDVQGIPGRVSLGIMSILTIITQILDIRKTMPPVSYVTAIDIWLFVCLMSVFLSLIEYAFAYNYIKKLQRHKQEDVEAAEQYKSVATTINGITRVAWTPIALPKTDGSVQSTSNRLIKNLLSNLNLSNLNGTQFSISKLDDNSKILFPILFLIFAIVYWTYYLVSEGGLGGGSDDL